MKERTFFQVRWKVRHMVFASRWLGCGHRHLSLKRATRCAKSHPGNVYMVVERRIRRVVWEPIAMAPTDAP